MSAQISFPAMLINNCDIGAYSKMEILETVGEKGVDDGKMLGGLIIDSEGRQFVIGGVRKLKQKNFLPSFLVSYKNRIVQVQYDLKREIDISVEELKFKVIDIVKNDKSFTETGLIKEIKGSDTILEIMESVGIE